MLAIKHLIKNASAVILALGQIEIDEDSHDKTSMHHVKRCEDTETHSLWLLKRGSGWCRGEGGHDYMTTPHEDQERITRALRILLNFVLEEVKEVSAPQKAGCAENDKK